MQITVEHRKSILHERFERRYLGKFEQKYFAPVMIRQVTPDVKYSTTEDNLNLIVDVNQPLAVDASVLNDVFKVDFSESLKCLQLSPSQMPYQIRRVKTCDGSHIDSNAGSFSTEAVINTFNFVCMNGDGKGSLVAKFPGNVAEGSYELTVNPYLYKAKTSETRKVTHG